MESLTPIVNESDLEKYESYINRLKYDNKSSNRRYTYDTTGMALLIVIILIFKCFLHN